MQASLVIVPTPLPAVVLDYSQEVQAHASGFARSTGVVANRPDHAGRYNNKLNYHEFVTENSEAAGSEIAVAQYMGIKAFTPTVDTFTDSPDISIGNLNLEIKWTRYLNGHLIIHRDYMRLTDVAVLVLGKSPVYQLAGWIPVLWAKKTRYLNSIDGNYWVSQRDLFEMSTLRKSIYGITED